MWRGGASPLFAIWSISREGTKSMFFESFTVDAVLKLNVLTVQMKNIWESLTLWMVAQKQLEEMVARASYMGVKKPGKLVGVLTKEQVKKIAPNGLMLCMTFTNIVLLNLVLLNIPRSQLKCQA